MTTVYGTETVDIISVSLYLQALKAGDEAVDHALPQEDPSKADTVTEYMVLDEEKPLPVAPCKEGRSSSKDFKSRRRVICNYCDKESGLMILFLLFFMIYSLFLT